MNSRDHIEECHECAYRDFCGGGGRGGRGRSFLHYATLDRRDPFCLMTKLLLHERTKPLAAMAGASCDA